MEQSNHTKYKIHLLGTILRQPLAFLGAVGIVSMLKGLITLHEDILMIILAYQSVTQPIWGFLIGWLFEWMGWAFPSWLKDYLTMGMIAGAASARAYEFSTG